MMGVMASETNYTYHSAKFYKNFCMCYFVLKSKVQ